MLEVRAKDLNISINREALLKLIHILDGDIDLAMVELQKFSLLNRAVTVNDIDRLVYSATPFRVESFLTKLFNGEDIISPLKRLIELGEDEYSIVRSLR